MLGWAQKLFSSSSALSLPRSTARSTAPPSALIGGYLELRGQVFPALNVAQGLQKLEALTPFSQAAFRVDVARGTAAGREAVRAPRPCAAAFPFPSGGARPKTRTAGAGLVAFPGDDSYSPAP